jgi:hypothetical protein
MTKDQVMGLAEVLKDNLLGERLPVPVSTVDGTVLVAKDAKVTARHCQAMAESLDADKDRYPYLSISPGPVRDVIMRRWTGYMERIGQPV